MKKLFYTFLFLCVTFFAAHAQSDVTVDTAVVEDDEYYDDTTEAVEEAPRELEKPVVRRVSNDSIRQLKRRGEFSYMKYADSFMRNYQNPEERTEETRERQEEREPSPGVFDSAGLKAVYWGIAIVVVLWLLWSIFNGKGSLFARNKSKPVEVEETVEEDIKGTHLEQLIERAIRAKDYRMAIRYMYLHTLELLGEKQLILLAPQKTNYQYVRELTGKPYLEEFSKLTMQYEYVWYGEFKLDDKQFGKVHEGFKTFKSHVA